MTRRLLLSYLAIALVVLFVHDVPLVVSLVRSQQERAGASLQRDASVLATYAVGALSRGEVTVFEPTLEAYARRTGGDVALLDAGGAVLSTAGEPDARVADPCGRLGTAALAGQPAEASPSGWPWETGVMRAAAPVAADGRVHGAVCVAVGTDQARRVRAWLTMLSLVGVATLAAVALSGRAVARSVTRPMQALRGTAAALVAGDLGARADSTAGPSEVREVAAAFNGVADRLVHLLAAQRAFIADASHQLRTPLTTMNLRLGQLRSAVRGQPEAGAAVTALRAETARFGRLVEGLLVLARAEATPAERRPTSVRRLLTDRRDGWAPLADERQVSLVVDAREDLLVLAEPEAVAQAIDNLVANACDVAPSASTITLAAAGDGQWVDLHVVDEGPGLSDAERACAFDRFWTTRPGGTGLGLAVVARVAIANGGDARLVTRPQGGLDAIIRLPRWREQPRAAVGRRDGPGADQAPQGRDGPGADQAPQRRDDTAAPGWRTVPAERHGPAAAVSRA